MFCWEKLNSVDSCGADTFWHRRKTLTTSPALSRPTSLPTSHTFSWLPDQDELIAFYAVSGALKCIHRVSMVESLYILHESGDPSWTDVFPGTGKTQFIGCYCVLACPSLLPSASFKLKIIAQ